MNTPLRLSPIDAALRSLQGHWGEVNGMPTLMHRPRAAHWPVGIADLSSLTRFGVKGANAAAWLSQQGIPVPQRPNTWRSLPPGGLVARLGLTEFLIEDGLSSNVAPQLAARCQTPPARVYPVLRQDLALALVGDRTQELLRQTCSVNFQAVDVSQHPVVLTSMIGVTVTIIPTEMAGQLVYRLWCDGTFGTYFWKTLIEMATELGGGAIGVEQVPFNTASERGV
ncbi:MAG TPA: aminomethyl transferase family protein [Synechococcales cyanobacterium M55_K2018_004]|nr:aminomethyl transferase family protein [Synechococcales cyanobacterium M55_K2018_004]